VELFYIEFRDWTVGVVYHIVDAAEMIDGLHNVVYARDVGGDAEGVGLKNETCLFFCETAAFDMVAVVGEIYLNAVVDAAFQV